MKNLEKIFFLLVLIAAPAVCAGQEPAADGAKDNAMLQLRQLKHELQLSRESYGRLKELYAQKETESRSLSEKIETFSRQMSGFQQLIERLKAEKEGLALSREKVGQRLSDLEKQNAFLDGKCEALSKEKEELSVSSEEARRRLGQELSLSKTEADNLRQQAGALERQLKEASGDREARLKAEQEKEARALAEKVSALEKRLKEAQESSALTGKEKQRIQEAAQKLEARLKAEQEKEAKALTEKIVGLEKSLKEAREFSVSAPQREAGLKAEKDKEIASLNEKIGLLEKSLKEARELPRSFSETATESAAEKLAVQSELDKLKREFSLSKRETEDLRQQAAALAQQLKENTGKLEARFKTEKDKEIQPLLAKIDSLEKALKESREQAGAVSKAEAKAEAQKVGRQFELEKLRRESEFARAEAEKLRSRADILAKEVEESKGKLASFQFKSEQVKEAAALREKVVLLEKNLRQTENASCQLAREKAGLQEQFDSLKKERDALNEKLAQEMGRKEENLALLKKSMDQELLRKDGELARMSSRLEEEKTSRKAEAEALAQKIEITLKELVVQKELSLRMVQEKAMLESLQSDLGQKARELERLKSMAEQERDKLAEQNNFLKNQYISISQEMKSLKEAKAKAKAGKEEDKELAEARRQMQQKLQEYGSRLSAGELENKTKEDIERQNKLLAEDFARLKDAYARLEQKYLDAQEDVRRQTKTRGRNADIPENATLRYNLGVMYAQNQQFDKAIQEFKKVLVLKPDDPETLYNLGVIYGESLNDRKQAIPYFKRYLSLRPDDTDAQRVRKYIMMWETYEQEIKDGK